MEKIRRKMDLKSAIYLTDKAKNDRSVFPLEFTECEHCGADYIADLGHDCDGKTIELEWTRKDEGEE